MSIIHLSSWKNLRKHLDALGEIDVIIVKGAWRITVGSFDDVAVFWMWREGNPSHFPQTKSAARDMHARARQQESQP